MLHNLSKKHLLQLLDFEMNNMPHAQQLMLNTKIYKFHQDHPENELLAGIIKKKCSPKQTVEWIYQSVG